jgi:hypothetical protein
MDHEPIDAYLGRVKKLAHSGARDMRLSFEEANALAASIGELLSLALQKPAPVVAASTPAVINGGSFSDR